MKLNHPLLLAALVAGSLFAGGAAVQAQDSSSTAVNTPPTNAPAAMPPRPRGGMNIDRIATNLGLTDDQKTQVQAALQSQRKQMQVIRTDDSLSTADKRAKYKELRDSFNASMKTILTPEQYTKWQTMAPGHHRPAPMPGADASQPATTNTPAAPPQ